MPKNGKSPNLPPPELFESDRDDLVQIVADNMRRCFAMAKRDPRLRDRTNPNALARHLREHEAHYGDTVGKSHLSRMVNGEGHVGTDVIQLIARAFGLQAWHLLMYGLEPSNPPLALVSETERRLYDGFQLSMRAIREEAASHDQTTDAGVVDADRDTAGAAKRGPVAGKRTPAGKQPAARKPRGTVR